MNSVRQHVADEPTLDSVLVAVQARVPYIKAVRDALRADGWLPCAELLHGPELLRAQILATAPGRGTDDPVVAASLYVQAYCFRVASVAVAAWALSLPVPTLRPEHLALRVARHRPAELAILSPNVARITAAQLVEELVGSHLAALFDNVRNVVRIGERLLYGNAAAAVMTVFRAVQSAAGPCGDPDIRTRAEQFASAADPVFGGLGSFSTITVANMAGDTAALGWFWDRTNCCLWNQTTSASLCDDCSLHDRAALDTSRRAALAGSPASTEQSA